MQSAENIEVCFFFLSCFDCLQLGTSDSLEQLQHLSSQGIEFNPVTDFYTMLGL